MHEVVKVTPIDNYFIVAEFENGEKRMADIKPLFSKAVFAPLKSLELFKKVYIEYGAVTWKDFAGNEIDICPDKLYMDSVPYNKVV